MYMNLTPHDICVFREADCTYDPKTRSYYPCANAQPRVFKPEPIPARCTQTEVVIGYKDGIPLLEVQYGEIENLPDPKPGVVYIVSAIVALAGRKLGRTDLAIPSRSARTPEGKIIGCCAFGLK